MAERRRRRRKAGTAAGPEEEGRGLAREVARRLKYYIDVQRKEGSFTPCGVLRDAPGGLRGKPACWTDQKEHDFSNIKLEASLRAFMGTAEDCHRKLQKAPEKQKYLENRIKKMAQSYIPERKNEGKGKNAQWQKGLHRASQKGLHLTATPFMSPEEVERLVSSAAKLIVAAISEIPPEKPGTTQDDASFLKRRDGDVKSIQTLDNSSRQHFSSIRFYKDGARRAKQARKSREDVKRTVELSNISSNSAQPKKFFPQPPPKPTASSQNRSSSVSGSQTGESKVHGKCIPKSKSPVSETLSVISEHKVFSHSPAEIAISKTNQTSLRLAPRPILRSPSDQEFRTSKSNSTRYSAESTTAVISTQLSMAGEKINAQGNSAAVSRCIVVPRQGDRMSDQENPKSKFLGDSEKSWFQKREQNACDLVSEKNSEYDPVCFEKDQQGSIPGILTQEYHGLDRCILHGLRVPEDAALSSALADKPTGHEASVQEDHSKGPVSMLKHGPSFLYELCQEMDRDSPADLTVAVTTKETDRNQSAHSLLNPPFPLNELGNSSVPQDPVSCMKMQSIALGKSHDQQMMSIPPKMAGGSSRSGLGSDCVNESLQQQDLGPPAIAPALSEALGSDPSEEEFTLSSASSSSSAASLARRNEQRTGTAKDADAADSSLEKALKAMPGNGTTWQDVVFQDSGKQRMTEARTNTDHETAGIYTSKIVYFSHFPKSF